MLQVYFEMAVNVLVAYGKDQAEAESLVEQAIAFDKLIAPHVRSAEESADYSKITILAPWKNLQSKPARSILDNS